MRTWNEKSEKPWQWKGEKHELESFNKLLQQ